jgi:glutaredoxin/glutathione-dependent peroxiredoxin
MTIAVGDRLPEGKLQVMGASGPETKTVAELLGTGKVALFAVPGAFTPTCSEKHLPGFVAKADALKAKGVDAIVCVAVNDVFVMNAWGKAQSTTDKVVMAADGGGAFTAALGLTLDTAAFGGARSKRYSMLIENGVVKKLNLEDGGGYAVSDAETLLSQL